MVEIKLEELISFLVNQVRALNREWKSIRKEIFEEVGVIKRPIADFFSWEGVSLFGGGMDCHW